MHSKRSIAIFICIALLIVGLTNATVYEAAASILSLSATGSIWLGAILAILSLGFIGATILGRYSYNVFTRLITRILSAYMGLFVYLFLAAAIYGLVVLSGALHAATAGEVLFELAIAASLCGLIHARKTYVKHISVPLDAPQWKGRRAVFVSDVHLGQVLGPGFARKVVNTIGELKPDIVFIGGDLFDGTTAPDLDALIAPFKGLHAPLGIFFITGNHEEFGDSSPFLKAITNAGITILRDKLVEIDGLQIIGVDDATSAKKDDLTRILASLNIDKSKPSILLRHEPKDLDAAAAAGISLQMSGHTHRAQQWPLEYIAQWAFGGYAYGLKKFGSMEVYTSSGVGTWGPPLRLGTRSEVVFVSF